MPRNLKSTLLGLNRANPLLLLTSEECGKFSVCSNHVDKLCKDPIKINAGKQKCRSCMKLMGERLASLKNSISLTIAQKSPVVMGEMICSQCRKVPLENEAELISFLQKEHRLATANNEADDIIGIGQNGQRSLAEMVQSKQYAVELKGIPWSWTRIYLDHCICCPKVLCCPEYVGTLCGIFKPPKSALL